MIPEIVSIVKSYCDYDELPESQTLIDTKKTINKIKASLHQLMVRIIITRHLILFIDYLKKGIFEVKYFYAFCMLVDGEYSKTIDKYKVEYKNLVVSTIVDLGYKITNKFDIYWSNISQIYDGSNFPKYIRTLIEFKPDDNNNKVKKLTLGKDQDLYYAEILKNFNDMNDEKLNLKSKLSNLKYELPYIEAEFKESLIDVASKHFYGMQFKPVTQYTDIRKFYHDNKDIFKFMNLNGPMHKMENNILYYDNCCIHDITIEIINDTSFNSYHESNLTENKYLFNMGIIDRDVSKYRINIYANYERVTLKIRFEYND